MSKLHLLSKPIFFNLTHMRNIKTFALITLSLSSLLAHKPLLAETAKPNVIVILADNMGYSDLGVQDVLKDLKTPNSQCTCLCV
jgi:hypothetical protein